MVDNLTAAFDEFTTKGEAVVDNFANTPELERAPATIYHYTTEAGLRSILESGKLWFTDIHCLNDPSEFRHGIDVALTALKQRAARTTEGSVEGKFTSYFDHALRQNPENIANFLVCCFSDTSENLGQWRAYGDDGQGYALGFETAALQTAFLESNPGNGSFSAFPIVYDDQKLEEQINRLLDLAFLIIGAAKEKGAELERDWLQNLSVRLASFCCHMSLYFKHPAYKNEREYRFLQTFVSDEEIPGIQRRYRPNLLVKYREFDWKALAQGSVKVVVGGPSLDGAVGQKFFDDCRRAFLPPPYIVSFSRSKIPYRSV